MLKIRFIPDDPEYDKKVELLPLFENIYLEENDCSFNTLVDLSGVSELNEKLLAEFKEETILVSPGKIHEIKNKDNVIAAYPWRHWSVIYSLREFVKSGTAGDLVSLRIIINLPSKTSKSEYYFYNQLLPEIIDLGCYIVTADLEQLHINRVEKKNICFVLAQFKNNIIAEIELNEGLPDSVFPVRFVKAYFKEGAFTNMPLGGDQNIEGSLIATDDKVERFVHEHMDYNRGDEINNLFFRMIYDIVNDFYMPETYTDFCIIQKTVQNCLQSNQPCTVKEIKQ